jgi:hypothetical protein
LLHILVEPLLPYALSYLRKHGGVTHCGEIHAPHLLS